MAGGFIQPDKNPLNTLNTDIPPGFQNGHFKQYALNVGRYEATTTIGGWFDLEFICNAVNNALGTTSKRFGKGWASRRYNGSISYSTEYAGSNFFFGDTSAFEDGKVGVCIESSTTSSIIFQLHNPSSNPPAASNFLLNKYNGSQFDLKQITAAPTTNYSTNPY